MKKTLVTTTLICIFLISVSVSIAQEAEKEMEDRIEKIKKDTENEN